MEAVVSSVMDLSVCGMVSLHRTSRTSSKAWPGRLEPRQVSGEVAQ